ncbi:MAG: Holliday junction branch migration protein RuvA [Bacillota bacterium]
MIASIRGRILSVGPGWVIIEAAGVGYRIFVPLNAISHFSEGQESLLYTYLNIREDAMLLYGFLSTEEKDIFQKLLSVNGIGPKIALSILSVLSLEQIQEGIQTQNFTYFSAVPGIGAKTAQRIVLEMAGKLPERELVSKIPGTAGRFAANEAAEALVALGYPLSSANLVVSRLHRENPQDGAAELVKKALQELVKVK